MCVGPLVDIHDEPEQNTHKLLSWKRESCALLRAILDGMVHELARVLHNKSYQQFAPCGYFPQQSWYNVCSIVSSQPLGHEISFSEPLFHISAVLLTCYCPRVCTGVGRWSPACFSGSTWPPVRLPAAAPSPSGSGRQRPIEATPPENSATKNTN